MENETFCSPSKKRKGSTESKFSEITVKMDPQLIHCTLCSDPLDRDGHIFQCTNGHLMCKTCADEAGTCPDCSTDTINRCVALENIVDELRTRCQFAGHGCKKFLTRSEKPAHEAHCSHAPLRCLVTGCSWTGSGNYIADHIRGDHSRICGSQSFYYNKVFFIKVKRQEPLLLLPGKDGTMFALLCEDVAGAAPGSVMSLVCVWRGAFQNATIYEYDVEVKKGRNSVTLKSVPQKWTRHSSIQTMRTSATGFLFIPQNFAGGSTTIEVDLRIRKSK